MNDFFTNRSCHTNHLFRKILKQIIFIAFLFLFSMCIQDDPEEVFSLKPGDSLPGFSVQDNKGGLISNTILKGKTSVIAFVNTGCPDCRKELPEIEKAYQQFRDDESIRFIAISRSQGYESLTDYWIKNIILLLHPLRLWDILVPDMYNIYLEVAERQRILVSICSDP